MSAFSLADRRRLARGVGWNALGAVGGALAPAFVAVANALYGPEALGRFALVAAVLEILSGLVAAGLADAVVRSLAAKDDHDRSQRASRVELAALRTALVWALLGGAAVGGALAAASPLFAVLWHRPTLVPLVALMAVNLPLVATRTVLLAAPRALLRMQEDVTVRAFAVPAAALVLAVALRPAGLGAAGLAVAVTLANALGVVLAAFLCHRHFPLGRVLRARGPAPGLLAFALPQGLNMTLVLSLWNLDMVLLGTRVTDAALGLYRTAAELARLVHGLRTTIAGAFAPLAARLYKEGQEAALLESLAVASGWILRVATPVIGLLVLLSGELLGAFHPAYRDHGGLLVLLLTGPLVLSAVGLYGNVLVMSGRSALALANVSLAAVLAAGANVILVPRIGIIGAALATTLGAVSLATLQVGCVLALFRKRPSVKPLVPPLLSLVSGLAAAWAVGRLGGLGPWAAAAVFVAFYAATLGVEQAWPARQGAKVSAMTSSITGPTPRA